ncbi:MAG: ParB/RepB/Spo0J family partition protein [Streptosporangiales bacterium]|jgi:ParB family chromosome partitioning protein|nr:ParB/RepB/Spo0J family partition protein [Streptosporangiales bacterium]
MASGRRTSLASLANNPVESVPGHSAPILVRLQPSQIAPTPLNSRVNFGSESELGELGESMRVRQLQPVVVVKRGDYLRLWPEHESEIGDADYVLVAGERRWRAAGHVSLSAIDAIERPSLADARTTFLDALFTENIDRKNLDAIEEAEAVESMVAECGTAIAAAKQFRRHETWVSQRRALLKLTPELKAKVRTGELPVRIARSIAAVPAAEQENAWRAAREAEQVRREDKQRAKATSPPPTPPDPADEPGGEDFTAVKTDPPAPAPPAPPPPSGESESGDFTAVKNPDPGTDPNPERGSAVSDDQPRPDPTVIQWDDLGQVADAIRAALGADDRRQLAAMIADD